MHVEIILMCLHISSLVDTDTSVYSQTVATNNCLAVRESPITWSSPFLPPSPSLQPVLHKNYTPDLGILPTCPLPSNNLPSSSTNNYQPPECIIPMSSSPPPQLSPRPRTKDSILPLAPSPDPDTVTSSTSLPELDAKGNFGTETFRFCCF